MTACELAVQLSRDAKARADSKGVLGCSRRILQITQGPKKAFQALSKAVSDSA